MDVEHYVEAAPSAIEFHLVRFWRAWVVVFVFVALAVAGYCIAFLPPSDFPSGSIVKIVRGTSASEVAAQLTDMRIIAHPRILRMVLRVSGGSVRVQAGPYLFNTPENLLVVAYRLMTGDYGIPPARITFPAGETARDAAERVHNAFPDISTSDFISKAQPYEGYLFPDTYLFVPSSDVDSIVKTMRENFDTKTLSFKND